MENAELKVEYLPVGELKQYAGNAKKHPKKQIAEIRESIEQFGFNDPIAIWKNGEIIEGHGRLLAALDMGLETVPVIRLDGLTDEERRAYCLAHNQTTLSSGYDTKALKDEIVKLPSIDMGKFGFDVSSIVLPGGEWYENERLRTDKAYNLDKLDYTDLSNDFWQMPVIKNDNHVPTDLIGFKYTLQSSEEDYKLGVHFYTDDYQFERVWNQPEKYVSLLRKFDCIISPDFSIYTDMPIPMMIWNTYRNRWLGAYFQSMGIKVIPNVNYAYENTYQFAFEGIPKGSIIARSTTSLTHAEEQQKMFRDGMEECIRRIEPSKILIYGGNIDFNAHGIEVIEYHNHELTKLRSKEKYKRKEKRKANYTGEQNG